MNPILAGAIDLARMFSPCPRHIGDGQNRAQARLYEHRVDQAQRVAPALAALKERRAEIARLRVKRWTRDDEFSSAAGRALADAPSHIKRMSREQAVRR